MTIYFLTYQLILIQPPNNSKKRCFNVTWMLETLYERCKNVVCQLG